MKMYVITHSMINNLMYLKLKGFIRIICIVYVICKNLCVLLICNVFNTQIIRRLVEAVVLNSRKHGERHSTSAP